MTTRRTRRASLAASWAFCLLAIGPSSAADATDERRDLSTWVMTYYQDPSPGDFVQKVREMSAAGLLHDPRPNARPDASVMFLGKIMAANAAEVPRWMDALAALPDPDIEVLKRAAWYSGAESAKTWLVEHGAAELANGPRPMLLSDAQAMPLQPHHVDQLWEWFFATGENEPLARIVSLFSLAHELPDEQTLDLLSPPTESDDPQLDQVQAYNYRLVKPALWSMASLAVTHDRVLQFLRQVTEEQRHPAIRAWAGQVVRIAEAGRASRQEP